MMLSMAATALAQVEGDEDGTDKETAPMAEAEIPSPEERNLLGNIDLVVKILGGIAAFFSKSNSQFTNSSGKRRKKPSQTVTVTASRPQKTAPSLLAIKVRR